MSEDKPNAIPQGNQNTLPSQPKQQSVIKAPRPAPKRPTHQPPRATPNKSSATARPKLKQSPPQQAQARKRPVVPNNKLKNPRLILWAKVILITFLLVSIGITIRAMININSNMKEGTSWSEELKRGNIESAAQKLFTLSSDAIDQVFDSDLSPEALMADFNDALPHLKQAGYVLTELEIEVGISPKLIPHFYHDPAVNVDLNKALEALKENTVGTALMISLAQASRLQKTVEISHMQFNHIEVELGPIPSLKLQYKNDHAMKDYIHYTD